MTHRRIVLGAVAAAFAAVTLPAPAVAQRAQPRRGPAQPQGTPAQTPLGPLDTQARQALVVDFATGATLLEKNADERMPPSSMSKLMTMYVVFEQLKAGRLQMEQTLPVSERAWRMGGSRMFVELNSQVRVEDLVRGVIVQSGNDACIVFAEAISGSEQQFAELMNETGRRIGLINSTFRNATGWPDPEHRTTCRDLATLARRIITDFPEYFRFYSERSFRFNNIEQANRNPLLGRVAGADGLKTGHTEEAGFGLTGTAMRGDRRVILVVNGLPSMRARAEETERLMEWAFREFEAVVLFRAQDTIEEVPVYLGERARVPMVGGRDLVLTLPRQWRRNLQVRLRYEAPLSAPVARGQQIGEMLVGGQGVPELRIPLLAGADVARLGLVSRIPAVVSRYVFGT
ncbi:D-alanyl-D-alanine carboxypeptidase (penicillin-binding protein 5/6) [Roseomonas alkaliterrae]|uniref:serine-type D-Ala-D-Ala carboxypeptidase n=2 Tax=Neoroseomonas alkaliterrae TaxID=1452450 RepID=A0A840Y3S4_9PROT|nr:D-alanyl-D-alanine carboxypeptidase family protein [Neoroseomonas alkaliterrae]MBB5691027.1 D-alanyl-D-alanine carboxypeptidase (penicillin-binding protein 5/6) [Neoroseomonas alkaliterrae]